MKFIYSLICFISRSYIIHIERDLITYVLLILQLKLKSFIIVVICPVVICILWFMLNRYFLICTEWFLLFKNLSHLTDCLSILNIMAATKKMVCVLMFVFLFIWFLLIIKLHFSHQMWMLCSSSIQNFSLIIQKLWEKSLFIYYGSKIFLVTVYKKSIHVKAQNILVEMVVEVS